MPLTSSTNNNSSSSSRINSNILSGQPQFGQANNANINSANKAAHAHSTSLLANESYMAGMSSDSELTSNTIRHHHRPHSSQSRIYHAHPAPRNSHSSSSRVSHYSDSSAPYMGAGPMTVGGKQPVGVTTNQIIMSDQQQQQQPHYLAQQASVSSSGSGCSRGMSTSGPPGAFMPITQESHPQPSSSSRQISAPSSASGMRRQLPARPFKHSMSIDHHSMGQYHQQSPQQHLISPSKNQQPQMITGPHMDPHLDLTGVYQIQHRQQNPTQPNYSPQSQSLALAADLYPQQAQPAPTNTGQQHQTTTGKRNVRLDVDSLEKQTAQLNLYDHNPNQPPHPVGAQSNRASKSRQPLAMSPMKFDPAFTATEHFSPTDLTYHRAATSDWTAPIGAPQSSIQQIPSHHRPSGGGIASGVGSSNGQTGGLQFKQTMSVEQYHYSPTQAQVAATATPYNSEHASPYLTSLGSSSHLASGINVTGGSHNNIGPDYVTTTHTNVDKFPPYRAGEPLNDDHILQQQHRGSQQDILYQHQHQHHPSRHLQHHGSTSSIYNQSMVGGRVNSSQQALRSQLQHQISSGSSTNSQSGSLRSSNVDIRQIEHPRAGSMSQLHQFHLYQREQQQQQQQQSPLHKQQQQQQFLRDSYNDQQSATHQHHYQQQPLRKGYTSLALGDSSSSSLLINQSGEPHSTSSSSSNSAANQQQPSMSTSAFIATGGNASGRDRSSARAALSSGFEPNSAGHQWDGVKEIGSRYHHSHQQHRQQQHYLKQQQQQAQSQSQPQPSQAQSAAYSPSGGPGTRSESSTGLPKSLSNSSNLTKKSNSTTQLSMTGTKKRLGFRKKQVTSFSVHRSEEVAPLAARHLVKQGSSVSEGDSSMSGDSSRGSLNINFKHPTPDELASISFIEGLGKGQMISRQGLASPYLGDIQLSLCDQRGNLEVDVIRARNLQAKANKIVPLTYVKLYLVKNRKCLAKAKTTLSCKRTLDPLFQQKLTFHEDYRNCILQAIVWGNFGKIDKKNFMGIAQISIDDLELAETVLSWYKLFLPSSLQTMPSKSLRSSLLSNSTESFTNTNNSTTTSNVM